MKTKLIKTSIRGASVVLLVSAGLFLLVAGTQGSDPAPSVGGFQCTNATIAGPWRRDPDLDWGGEAHV